MGYLCSHSRVVSAEDGGSYQALDASISCELTRIMFSPSLLTMENIHGDLPLLASQPSQAATTGSALLAFPVPSTETASPSSISCRLVAEAFPSWTSPYPSPTFASAAFPVP